MTLGRSNASGLAKPVARTRIVSIALQKGMPLFIAPSPANQFEIEQPSEVGTAVPAVLGWTYGFGESWRDTDFTDFHKSTLS